MNVLAIDTATELLCVSARKDARASGVKREEHASITVRRGLQHSPTLLSLVDRLLAELSLTVKDINLIVCSIGPGSFTGIRIGLATARGISFGCGCPLTGVSTLDAFARPFEFFSGDVYPVIDARKGNIYTARFRDGTRRGDYHDVPPAELARMLDGADRALLCGPDSARIRDILFTGTGQTRVLTAEWVDPSALLLSGLERYEREGADPSSLTPLYLRKSEAEIACEPKQR